MDAADCGLLESDVSPLSALLDGEAVPIMKREWSGYSVFALFFDLWYHSRLTGISRLWTWTLDSKTLDFGPSISPKHTPEIALILNCARVH